VSSTGTNDNNSANNGSNTVVTTVFGAPVGLVATAVSINQVDMTWTAVANADHYDVVRSAHNSGYGTVGSSMTPSFTDSGVVGGIAAGTTYLYKIRAVTATGQMSVVSALDPATTIVFTDDPLVAGTTVAQAIHLMELRTTVDAFRDSAGKPGGSYTDAASPGVLVQAVHVQQLRDALDEARDSLGLTAISYTDPTISSGVTKPKPAHFQEVREGVK
jgi:hypothetical protein